MIALNQSIVQQAPKNMTVALDHYGVISVAGDDAKQFLHGQLTCDVQGLQQQTHLFGAHCDPTGKMFSAFWLIPYQDQLLLVMRRDAIAASLAQFKKYSVFSKVVIEDASNDWFISGLIGSEAQALCVSDDSLGIAIQIDSEPEQWLQLTKQPFTTEYPADYWDALEIERVRPQLSADNSQQFVPQMLNIQAFDGISFTKGCYIGQETIARMRYLGKQKRALFRLSGSAAVTIAPATELERQVGDNWRRAGTVIMAVNRSEHQYDLLAVLPNDIEQGTAIRVKGDDDSFLEIHSLPYQLG